MNRPPPTNDAPPAYTLPQSITRRANLRPAVLCITFFGCIWGIVAGAATLRRRNDYDYPIKIDTVFLVLAIIYFVCAALEAFGFFSAWRQSIAMARTYFWISVAIAFLVTAGEVMRTATHFSEKSGIINACIASYKSDISSGRLTQNTVDDFCHDRWRSSSYFNIGLLIFSLLIAFFFASLAASWLHQTKNPQLLRTHATRLNPAAASNQYAYPLQPYGTDGQPGYPQSANPYGSAPPPSYGPGGMQLPSYDNPYGVDVNDDKSPAPGSTGYAPPPGPPPAAQNPFADQVEHVQLVRRDGETTEEFEQRQHEMERTRQRFAGSMENVALGGRGAEGRV
ncbi:hypothetical protein JCM11251_007447 [Rhodosporidiobolus azoricus]